MLDVLDDTVKADPQVAALIARARQAIEESQVAPPLELVTRIAENDADLDARLALAEHYVEQKAWAPAFEQLLEIVRRDRGFRDDIGRKTLLAVFTLLDGDARVSRYRRLLASALY